jgi:hypothetical protein
MKKILSIVLVVVISLVFSNCGKSLTEPEAKEAIKKAFDDYAAKTDLIPDVEKTIKEIGSNIAVTEVKKEGDLYLAKTQLKKGDKDVGIDMKLSYQDGAWQLAEITLPEGSGKACPEALEEIRVAILKGKQKATMGDLKTLGAAIESYITDMYFAPKVESAEELAKLLEPFYIKKAPLTDGFGYAVHYTAEQDVYSIGSGGRDGKFGGFEQTGYYVVTDIEGFGNDIIFANGTFVHGPKVK